MKRITIIASGTRGDVQPAMALGAALKGAGGAPSQSVSTSASPPSRAP
jgi:UDP:flavonoid glycosyltransferase YjiC (YdhE family)